MTVLESAGKVPQGEWLSADPLWTSYMKSLEAEVTSAAPPVLLHSHGAGIGIANALSLGLPGCG